MQNIKCGISDSTCPRYSALQKELHCSALHKYTISYTANIFPLLISYISKQAQTLVSMRHGTSDYNKLELYCEVHWQTRGSIYTKNMPVDEVSKITCL